MSDGAAPNGILVMDKPADFTSFDVVAKLRGICGTRKIGHSGTLDPMATGVLPVFVGGAVKAVDLQPRHDKTYEAGILFGTLTDTGDITGEVLKTVADVAIDRGRLCEVLAAFCGKMQQLPPMYSAVKVNGKPLYRYAREGKQVERKERAVTIHSIDLLAAEPQRCTLRVHCSKGTYIRTLAEDIGAALSVPATLESLRRTQAGAFAEKDTYTFAEIQAAKDEGRLEALLLPVDHVFSEMPRLDLPEPVAKRLRNGAPARWRAEAGAYRVYEDGAFLGLASVDGEGTLKVQKFFIGG